MIDLLGLSLTRIWYLVCLFPGEEDTENPFPFVFFRSRSPNSLLTFQLGFLIVRNDLICRILSELIASFFLPQVDSQSGVASELSETSSTPVRHSVFSIYMLSAGIVRTKREHPQAFQSYLLDSGDRREPWKTA